MRKKLSLIIMTIMMTLIYTCSCFATSVITTEKGEQETLDLPELNSDSAIVVDIKTGYTLYEKNIFKKHYPASITKILTSMLVLDNCEMDETVTFSHDAVFAIKSGESSAYADEGENMTVLQCMYGLMLVSANDIANALAEHVAGSNQEFAKLMNEKAKELGCINSNFVNPHGLHDENHYTCAYDMALIGKKAYSDYSMYRELIHTIRYEVPPTNKMNETRYWKNSNKLMISGEKFYYPDCFGGKTGYTTEAGETLVTYANINGRVFMVVTLNSPSSSGAYSDNIAIYVYLKENVDSSYFERLDEKYMADRDKFEEETETSQTDENESSNITNTDSKDNGNEDEKSEISFFDIIINIFKIIVILAVLVYAVLRIRLEIKRYKRKKRRKRRRRKM